MGSRLAILAILALLAADRGFSAPPVVDGGSARAEERRALSAELDALAARIEALKRAAAAGQGSAGELEQLLARAQELAARLEGLDRQAGPPSRPRPASPDPEELRERADALRDAADHAAATLTDVERRLAEARRREDLAEHMEALTAPGDLFAEASPRRSAPAGGGVPTGGASSAAPGTAGSTSSAGAAGAGAPAAGAAPTGVPFVPTPPGPAGEELAPRESDSTETLLKKRALLERQVADLRGKAEALEAEAKAAEAVR
ncbi:MAG TPA: hypothetical protein VMG32_14385 [Anaeromyxobacteraceae bacterium]|nr:hypothetical protein [Anaeromyxobacteraceae bacterium]